MLNNKEILERFLTYVKIDTESDQIPMKHQVQKNNGI